MMEGILFFMIVSVIYMALIFLRLRDIDHNADEYIRLIRRDIIDHDSHINIAVSDCTLQVSEMEKNLTTEIACLATKNNEDIKRVKDGYAVGDVLKFDDIEMYVFCKTKLDDGRTHWSLFGQNGNTYEIYSDCMPEDIELVRHVDVKSLFS